MPGLAPALRTPGHAMLEAKATHAAGSSPRLCYELEEAEDPSTSTRVNGRRHPAPGTLLGLMHQMSTVEVARLSLWDTRPCR